MRIHSERLQVIRNTNIETTSLVSAPKTHASNSRWAVLDGWRALSIVSVLSCHMLPLGPRSWNINGMAGVLGMVLFFTLSGFLIASTLLARPDWLSFLVRRACRILPLAVLAIIVALTWQEKGFWYYVAHLLFYINYRPDYLTPLTSPLWSLCVEIQFYVFIAALVAIGGRRALWALTLACLAVTSVRIWTETYVSIESHLRADEILAGAVVALLHRAEWAGALRRRVASVPLLAYMVLLLACCHPSGGVLNYFRPYVGSAMVASTLWRQNWATGLLSARILRYLADVSYAVYVIHPIMRLNCLNSTNVWRLYLVKRPIGFALTFLLAHLSTFYYEKWWINLGKRITGHTRGSAPIVVSGSKQFATSTSG
jgi:peptidoglycan/LPS O-acetylase OafA/YrhL